MLKARAKRENVISQIEETGRALWASGQCASWFDEAEAKVAKVSRTVNGPLFELLAKASVLFVRLRFLLALD